ncbi:hypothetical protein BGZ60DRAFT_359079, partial [Tricladium varicosporioides]
PAEKSPGKAHSIPIWEAARATTAAPFYFDTIDIANMRFCDGGLGTNNPSHEMCSEVISMNGGDPHSIDLLLSIGTGESKPVTMFANGRFSKYLAVIQYARRLATDSNRTHEATRDLACNLKIPYYRLNVPKEFGIGDMKLDEWKQPSKLWGRKESTLKMIERSVESYCTRESVNKDIRKVAEILVKHRRSRKGTPMWHLVATG